MMYDAVSWSSSLSTTMRYRIILLFIIKTMYISIVISIYSISLSMIIIMIIIIIMRSTHSFAYP